MDYPTIQGIIQEVDALCPNTLGSDEKIKWLSRLDGQLYDRYMKGREGAPESWEAYTPDTPETTVLLVQHPYDDIYVHYLQAQIALYHGENDSYSDFMALVGQSEKLFAESYARNHPRCGGGRFRF